MEATTEFTRNVSYWVTVPLFSYRCHAALTRVTLQLPSRMSVCMSGLEQAGPIQPVISSQLLLQVPVLWGSCRQVGGSPGAVTSESESSFPGSTFFQLFLYGRELFFQKDQGVIVFKCQIQVVLSHYFLSKYLLSAYYMLDPTLLTIYLVIVSASG